MTQEPAQYRPVEQYDYPIQKALTLKPKSTVKVMSIEDELAQERELEHLAAINKAAEYRRDLDE